MNRTRLDHVPALVFAFLLALAIVTPAQAGPGDLDVRFGTHGQAEVPGQVDSSALIELPDGRILVFGKPVDSAARSDGAIAVARLFANGTPDTAFGPGGHLDLRLGSEPEPVPTDALLLADGRVLVAGYFAGDEDGGGGWPYDQRRSGTPGWIVRLSADAAIDPSFGVGGVARAAFLGVDRIGLLADGAIAAAGPHVLERLEPNGTPAFFPGSETSIAPLGSSYRVFSMVLMQDGSVITSAGYENDWESLELYRTSVSGQRVGNWPAGPRGNGSFSEIASLARDRDGTRLTACGSTYDRLVVQRWRSDGTPDATFASATGGNIWLGVETRPNYPIWRAPLCRALLPGPAGDHVVVGDWSKPYEYGGGTILLAHLDASGAIDAAFDSSGLGRELTLGKADQWSSWFVADAATASDGSLLLIARRSSELFPNDVYSFNALGEQRTLIARVEVLPSQGVGSIGFNDGAVRVAERRRADLNVYRSAGTAGAVSVRYEVLHDTSSAADVVPTAGTLTWADRDRSARTIRLEPVNDAALEGEERFRVRLSDPTGGASLGVPEIEVTIEDDDALGALQFSDPAPRIVESEPADIVITPPAAAGPILVRYAVAPDLDPDDGSPRSRAGTHSEKGRVGELRWDAGDVSSRAVQVGLFGQSYTEPDRTIYVALADVTGTLRDGNDWKVARVTVVDQPGQLPPPPALPPANPAPIPSTPERSSPSGGGAISLAVLPFLALALLLNFGVRFLGAAIYRRKTMNAHSVLLVSLVTLGTLQFDKAIASPVAVVSTSDIVVTTPAELESALSVAAAGQRIRVRAGTYDLARGLVLPDHVTLTGEGRMEFDADGLPSGFEPFSRTILRATPGLVGDVLTLGDGTTLRGLVLEDVPGRSGNVVTLSSRASGDFVAATIVQCEIVAPNPGGVGPQGPTGRAFLVMTQNPNMAAPPSPHEGAELSIDMRRTIIRSPGNTTGITALIFASRSRIALSLTRNVVGHGLSVVAGVGRPDPVTESSLAIESAHNLYRANGPSSLSQGLRLVGGDTARLPGPSGSSTGNSVTVHSRDDRVEGFAVGVFAAGGARIGPLAAPSSQNSVDLELTRMQLQSTVADLQLYGAWSSVSGMSAGDGNSLRLAMRRSSGSGGLANLYLNSFSPVMDELGVENRLVIAGNPNAFAHTNTNIAPAPPAEFFQQCE